MVLIGGITFDRIAEPACLGVPKNVAALLDLSQLQVVVQRRAPARFRRASKWNVFEQAHGA